MAARAWLARRRRRPRRLRWDHFDEDFRGMCPIGPVARARAVAARGAGRRYRRPPSLGGRDLSCRPRISPGLSPDGAVLPLRRRSCPLPVPSSQFSVTSSQLQYWGSLQARIRFCTAAGAKFLTCDKRGMSYIAEAYKTDKSALHPLWQRYCPQKARNVQELKALILSGECRPAAQWNQGSSPCTP